MIGKKLAKYCVVGLFLFSICEVHGEEKSSLTFVIDDTGSMGDDIAQVKIGANAIFDTVLKSNESQIEDFVLVTFNDPDTALRTVTKERNDFKNALSSINVHGGDDCPEYAMSGIIQGIENSRPGSSIYVFTDASAKDYKQYDDVKNLAIRKQIQVVFVLTGLCDTKSSRDYKVYESLAKDTNGQVFHLGKQEIGTILHYVMENVKGRRTTLASATFPAGKHTLTFDVDGKTKDPIVSAAGDKPTLNITGPDGSKADSETLVHKDNIAIEKLLNPKSGIHTVEVVSGSNSSVIVSARTEVKFQHGFSTFKPSSIKETTTRPLPDIKSHITIELTDGDIELNKIKILDMDDKLIKELPLYVLNEKDKLYITQQDDLPNTMFKIAVIGYDPVKKETITRVLPPIAPQPKIPGGIPNKAPTVSILGDLTVNAEFDKPLQLTCKVIGYPQPNIIWLNKDSGEKLRANVSVVEIPNDFISILYIDRVRTTTNYECKASNPSGSDSMAVAVKTKVKPYIKVLQKPKDTVINYHDEGQISCKVDAYPPATITWYKKGRPLVKNENIDFSDDNSVLKIKKMDTSDAGSYMCEIKNDHFRKILWANITIPDIEIPVIDKTIEAIHVRPGSDAVINCIILKGYPKPNIYWYYDDGSYGYLKPIEEWNNTESNTIHNLSLSNAGAYSCFAENEIGDDYHVVELSVEYAPLIKRDLEEIRAKVGESVYMSCYVDGVPDPVVTWYKDNIPISRGDSIYIYRDHSFRMTVGIGDSGNYSCNATNEFGTTSRQVKVEVYVPVTITLPKETKMNIIEKKTLVLPCLAKGYPTPATEWTYHSFDSSVPPRPMQYNAFLCFSKCTNNTRNANKASGITFHSKSLGSSTLKLRNMQLNEDGYYTCTASNSGGQTNLTYEVHILARPLIDKKDKKFRVVEGDTLLMKCNASGIPPPITRWLKNGFWVASGDDFTIENGTFIMHNINKKAEGVYVCEASNSLGNDIAIYEVIVEEIPRPGVPTSTIFIGESSTSAVRCDVPHKRTDHLRWFKNGALIHTGELTITNARVTDAGLYTCRVSNLARSASGNVMVKVGFKPKFTRDEKVNIDYEESASYLLSCEASGDPKPEYTWWHNGEVMNTTGYDIHFVMEMGTHGRYVCDARNQFGNVVRTFNITPKDCLIDIKNQPSKLQPLMVSPSLRWPENVVKNGFMSIVKTEYVYLFCPNHFKMFPQSYVRAICEGGTTFKINGRSYELSNLECTEKMTHFIEKTGRRCYPGNTELLRVAYTLKGTGKTVKAYEVCLDKTHNRPLYTKMRIRSSVADVDYLATDWSDDDKTAMSVDDAYQCSHQINVTSLVLGRWFHRDDGCCFAKRQLVSPKDLLPGIAQNAAYSHLNVVPHWSTCNVDSNNWNEVEQRVRTLAKAAPSEVLVFTGVADDLTLPDTHGSSQDIYITDRKDNRQAVPKYLWKVVQEPTTQSSLVIIQVNVPDLLPSEAAKYILCRDICNTTEWMRGSTWYDVSRGFTYCCSLEDFEKTFGYRRVFKPYKHVFNGDFNILGDPFE